MGSEASMNLFGDGLVGPRGRQGYDGRWERECQGGTVRSNLDMAYFGVGDNMRYKIRDMIGKEEMTLILCRYPLSSFGLVQRSLNNVSLVGNHYVEIQHRQCDHVIRTLYSSIYVG